MPSMHEGPRGRRLWLGGPTFSGPALWEDGVLRELPAGAPAIDSRQSAPSPSGPSSGRSSFGARQMEMEMTRRR